MSALGAGAGAFEGDEQRKKDRLASAQLGLQAEQLRQKAQQDSIANQQNDRNFQEGQRRFDAATGIEQRQQERQQANIDRTFTEGQRQFDTVQDRADTSDAFKQALTLQDIADKQQLHKANDLTYRKMMQKQKELDEQEENKKRLQMSGVGILLRAAYESPTGQAPKAVIDQVRQMTGDDSIIGAGQDKGGSGHFVVTSFPRNEDGSLQAEKMSDGSYRPLKTANGAAHLKMTPVQIDKAITVLGNLYGQDYLKSAGLSVQNDYREQMTEIARQRADISQQRVDNSDPVRKSQLELLQKRIIAADEAYAKVSSIPKMRQPIADMRDELMKQYDALVTPAANPAAQGGESGSAAPAGATAGTNFQPATPPVGKYNINVQALSGQDKSSYEWAISNPSDPRSDGILKFLSSKKSY